MHVENKILLKLTLIKVDSFYIFSCINYLNFSIKVAKDPKDHSDDDDDGTQRKRRIESNRERQNRLYTGRWRFRLYILVNVRLPNIKLST